MIITIMIIIIGLAQDSYMCQAEEKKIILSLVLLLPHY